LTAGSVTSGSIEVPVQVSALTPGAAELLAARPGLISGLEGDPGYGTLALLPDDDNSSGPIDIRSVFGPDGINFFGQNYTSIYVNNNGNITFGAPTGQYTPSQIGAGFDYPIIAVFWGDVDTRAAGNVYYDLDATDGVMTITWDHVGYFDQHADRLNSFQIVLVNEGSGNFDIVYRYADIQWTTGDLSGGAPARAGYSAGDDTHYFELPQSGDVSALLSLPETPGNTSVDGVDQFDVRNGVVGPSTLTTTGTINFSDVDLSDVHSVQSITYTGSSAELGTLTLVQTADTTGTGTGGQFVWTYTADSEAVRAALDSTSTHSRIEAFEVVISDGHGGTISQTVSVTLTEAGNHAATFGGDTTGEVVENYVEVTTGGTIAHDVDSGTLTVQDVDSGEAHFRPIDPDAPELTGTYGNFTFNASNGYWTYTLIHDRADSLAADQHVQDRLTVTSADGTTQDITVDITGTNDAPEFTGHDREANYVANGPAVSLADRVSASDIDSADYAGGSLTATVTAGGHEGDTLSIAESQYIHFSASGNIVSFDSDGNGEGADFVQIGTLTDNFNSLTIALNGNATDAAVARLTQAIQFANAKPDPEAGTRTVTFTLNDGDGTAHGGHDFTRFDTTVRIDHAPVIVTDNLQIGERAGATTISGLSVSDADATSAEIFTITATTSGVGSGSVTPPSGSGSLANINTTLDNGVTYHPGATPPLTGMVTVTVADSFGAADTMNFIFNQAGTGPVTLQGTAGKDVIFATGYDDTLTGGAGADQFVFSAHSGHDTITDFTPGEDRIDLLDDLPFDSGSTASFNDWINNNGAVEQLGNGDTQIHLVGGNSILLSNVDRSSLHMNDFILHPGPQT
jgi:VCBS repeat-containing protein